MSLKIGAIAQRLGTTVRTLRFYEENGLVHPSRSPGGTRLYTEEDEARFAALLALARLGFSLQQLAGLAGLRAASRTGDEASRAVASRLMEMDAELEERVRAIERQRQDIEHALALVRRCHGCRRRPARPICDACPASVGVEDSTVLQVVWDEAVPR
ncbi:MerR family transcriptional regulator [Imhoffiella purpurea]|uniref:Transcriptional regulator, MerR family n=1 Tax=Imhoffiella purpurea TaxID=1249627 RepID=W9VZY2_9GAMM|nr:MerR family transcriptional regulator [Imhoffiella purpurea]EXJ15920.1 transcriptional regulator, MerR family [Imhoffiella purpurea]